jgi:hypothetical protein
MNVWAFRIAGFLGTDTERPSATEVAVGASLIALHQHTRDRDVKLRGRWSRAWSRSRAWGRPGSCVRGYSAPIWRSWATSPARRSHGAAAASERRRPIVGRGLLAAACVFLGVGAPLVLAALDRVARSATGLDIRSELIVPKADRVRPVQKGDVNLYVLYVFVVVLVAYAVYAS